MRSHRQLIAELPAVLTIWLLLLIVIRDSLERRAREHKQPQPQQLRWCDLSSLDIARLDNNSIMKPIAWTPAKQYPQQTTNFLVGRLRTMENHRTSLNIE